MSVFLPLSITNLLSPQAWNQITFWLLALEPEDTDVIAQFQQSFNHFVESGQVWALAIGLVLGYLFRSFTSY
ncbi:hypothetical protein PCC7424_2890 [Gloeothece citriformis PCC 7424]|uniref:Uncharacterized protein n=1 Tax=Gloeothece citriformis (strain PCC 7424) TaxID=65393 RepID=B7K8U7_GLOC7|nr:hypothetical protein [Gloeothece citriformis]ACK71295.1 hypothetical protein PCC7424_2890 [Gloeothece citriformis PCC 7424]